MTAELARNAGRGTADRSEARRVARLPVPGQQQGGRFTKRKGKAFPTCCATLLSAPMFSSPAHQSAFSQVTDKLRVGGVVLKPGRKTKRAKGRGRKIKFSACASAIYVRGRYDLCAALVRGWRQGVDTDAMDG